jgi:DNA modification methylase
MDAIRASLRLFGQQKNIVILPDGIVIAGSGWLAASVAEDVEYVDVKIFDGTMDQARAYGIIDNRTAELAEWDTGQLHEAVTELSALDDYEIDDLGFTEDELAAMIGDADPFDGEPPLDPDELPPASVTVITRPGDIWRLGDNLVMCGDSRNADDVGKLLDGEKVNLAITSPPYARQRKYDEDSGFKPIPPDEYVAWFEAVQTNVAAALADDGSWLVNIKAHADNGQRDLYVHDLVIAHVREWAWRFVDEFCWVDTKNGVPGRYPSMFKDAWESVWHFTRSDKIKFDPEANAKPSEQAITPGSGSAGPSGLLGPHQTESGIALPSNVLHIAAGSSETMGHTATFPVELPRWFIASFTDPGDLVLDPFVGSGSTVIAGHLSGRFTLGMDISPAYVDMTCRRWQMHTGDRPVLKRTGKPRNFALS